MESVWVKTNHGVYVDVEKIRSIRGHNGHLSSSTTKYEVKVEIGSNSNTSIYDYKYSKNEVVPDSTINTTYNSMDIKS
ncbi:MAG: hypothetical protein K8S18_17230 [Desulfobacula sp.]|nr:hypothetical protein [Desulfobacula sp.]